MSGGLERVSLDKNLRHPMVVIREHLLRYTFALQYVFDKDVLDVACGTGYGMHLMSLWAKSITGYDNSQEAINVAKRDFRMKCSAFIEVKDLDQESRLSNNMAQDFDVVTCFETLEHLNNPEKLLENIRKHLRPKGMLLISVPNKLDLVDNSEWHKHAFNFNRMEEMLSRQFPGEQREIWGQDQYGMTKNLKKPYLVIKVKL